MKSIFEINSRTSLIESAETKHFKLIEFLKTLEAPWGIPKDIDIPFPSFGQEFVATSKIDKFLSGIKMSAFYRYRNKLDDTQLSDDRIYIEFNSKKVNYYELVTSIFPRFVESFDAYIANIFCQPLIYKDYEGKKNGDKRKIVNRVYPVSFYDAILCKTFFKHSPEEISKLLEKVIYKAEVFNNGILIIADTKPFSLEESLQFESLIKSLLEY